MAYTREATRCRWASTARARRDAPPNIRSMDRRALLIINSPRHVAAVVAALRAQHIECDVRRHAHGVASGNYALAIAAGGDNTVAAVAAHVLGSRTPLGIIPLGTRNTLATRLGIPRDDL